MFSPKCDKNLKNSTILFEMSYQKEIRAKEVRNDEGILVMTLVWRYPNMTKILLGEELDSKVQFSLNKSMILAGL
jgi:hypothetical protein